MDHIGGGYCRENLVGQGFIAKKKKKAIGGKALPNIEDPQELITSWNHHPKPAGFGFYGKTWSPRGERLGTYDETWRKERSPRLPADFSFDFHNAAHPDLQVPGYLSGTETVEMHHLTPDGYLRFHLPGARVAAEVTKSDERLPATLPDILDENEQRSKASVESVTMHLDTLCLMPDEKRFYLVWRGLCRVMNLTAIEVQKIQIKDQSRCPKPLVVPKTKSID
jgi:hypothetical protein